VWERRGGSSFDSKEIRRMVEATSGELDAWRQRDLSGTRYRFLYLDGTSFVVQRRAWTNPNPRNLALWPFSTVQRCSPILPLDCGATTLTDDGSALEPAGGGQKLPSSKKLGGAESWQHRRQSGAAR
jgi:hypothetical protein